MKSPALDYPGRQRGLAFSLLGVCLLGRDGDVCGYNRNVQPYACLNERQDTPQVALSFPATGYRLAVS
jgi:hypothetical protein